MPQSSDTGRALVEGAYRSLRACSLPVQDSRPVAIWRRHKWAIIGAGLFLLLDLIAGLAASTAGVKF
ncbi:MAG: hypothetical protein AABY85_01870 [Gemmatimonadota bacterium]|jgi:hypothetical protein